MHARSLPHGHVREHTRSTPPQWPQGFLCRVWKVARDKSAASAFDCKLYRWAQEFQPSCGEQACARRRPERSQALGDHRSQSPILRSKDLGNRETGRTHLEHEGEEGLQEGQHHRGPQLTGTVQHKGLHEATCGTVRGKAAGRARLPFHPSIQRKYVGSKHSTKRSRAGSPPPRNGRLAAQLRRTLRHLHPRAVDDRFAYCDKLRVRPSSNRQTLGSFFVIMAFQIPESHTF